MSKIIYESLINYLSSVRLTVDPLIKEMELFAAEKRIPILDWKAGEFLELLIKTSKPKNVLEIGMAIGYSSIRIAKIISEKSSFHTIEKSRDNLILANEFIKRANLSNKIQIHAGEAEEIIPKLKTKFDFIFLDADKEDYEALFNLSLNVLKKGGIIFIDNLLWHGYAASKRVPKKFQRSTQIIRQFNNMFIGSSLIDSTIFPIGDGIGIGIKK